jgi:hypothetical protein
LVGGKHITLKCIKISNNSCFGHIPGFPQQATAQREPPLDLHFPSLLSLFLHPACIKPKTAALNTMNDDFIDDCLLFVDDSNVWIEAQKFAALGNTYIPKLADGDRDPRLRIDIGKLVDTLCDGRIQRQSYIYGSRPPPNDMVWNQYKKFKFGTKIYDRGANGKEKEVDNSMTADLTDEAAELRISARSDPEAQKRKDRTVFIVITGDRDMLPAVRKVLKSGIRVELWGWDSGMAKEYLRERNDNPLLAVKFLDTIFSQVSFTNYRSTRNSKIVPAQAIVICEPEESTEEPWDESYVARRLLQMGRLFYTTRSKTGTEIFVEFPRVSNIEAVINQAQEYFDEGTIISWPTYASRFNKDNSVMLETSNMFAPLENDNKRNGQQQPAAQRQTTSEPSTELGSAYKPRSADIQVQEIKSRSTDPDNEEGWQRVPSKSHSGKAHIQSLRRLQRCSRGQHCGHRGECGYKHTEKELTRFREYPNQDFTKWKSRACNKNFCRKGERCPYAHNKQEAWCLSCKDEGHYTEECRGIA